MTSWHWILRGADGHSDTWELAKKYCAPYDNMIVCDNFTEDGELFSIKKMDSRQRDGVYWLDHNHEFVRDGLAGYRIAPRAVDEDFVRGQISSIQGSKAAWIDCISFLDVPYIDLFDAVVIVLNSPWCRSDARKLSEGFSRFPGTMDCVGFSERETVTFSRLMQEASDG